MSRKSYLSKVFVSVWCLFLFFNTAKADDNQVKIGSVLSLTGSLADFGNHSKNGLLIGVETINSKGGVKGRKLSLILEDSKTDPKSAVAAIIKLINIDKVKYVIGDLSSGTTLAMAPIAEKSKVILFAPGASNPQMREAGDFIFRNWVSDEFDGKIAASYAVKELKLKTFVVIEQQNTYGRGLSEAFQSTIRKNNGKIALVIPVQDNALDHRDAAVKIKSIHPDAVYLATHTKEGASSVRQIVESGYKGMLISNLVVESPEFSALAKGAMEGIVYTAPFQNEQASGGDIAEFIRQYKERFGDKPDAVAAHAFDAVLILAQAITNAKSDSPEAVRDALYAIKNFPGTSGETSFDKYGDVTKPLLVKKIVNGKPNEIKLFKVEE